MNMMLHWSELADLEDLIYEDQYLVPSERKRSESVWPHQFGCGFFYAQNRAAQKAQHFSVSFFIVTKTTGDCKLSILRFPLFCSRKF